MELASQFRKRSRNVAVKFIYVSHGIDARGEIEYKVRDGVFADKIGKTRHDNLNVALVGSCNCWKTAFQE